MKKSMLLHGGAALLATVLMFGCATGGGASDEEQIQALLQKWEQAAVAADMDAVTLLYSDDFAHDGYDYDAPRQGRSHRVHEIRQG